MMMMMMMMMTIMIMMMMMMMMRMMMMMMQPTLHLLLQVLKLLVDESGFLMDSKVHTSAPHPLPLIV